MPRDWWSNGEQKSREREREREDGGERESAPPRLWVTATHGVPHDYKTPGKA
jgi:hypothetical protein